jgi:hypothetical protein
MIAKLGFIVLFLVFAALVFLIGATLPGDLRARLPLLQRLMPAAPAAASTTSASPPKALAPAAKQDAPPPLESLLLPARLPEHGRYAVQAGIFPSQGEAEALAARIDGLHLPQVKTTLLAARDRAGQDWWIAAAGERDRPEDLETLRDWLDDRLSLPGTRALLLPAAKP